MFATMTLPEASIVAPDGSAIRPLLEVTRGGLSHCTLPPGGVSLAVRHRTIEELWFILAGRCEVWRRLGDVEEVVEAAPGTCVSLPTGTHFQFRTRGAEPLVFVIATLPPWPGMEEAVRVADHWPTGS